MNLLLVLAVVCNSLEHSFFFGEGVLEYAVRDLFNFKKKAIRLTSRLTKANPDQTHCQTHYSEESHEGLRAF